MKMRSNTIATAGDHTYLWGLFLLLASMRREGMNEPVVVGVKDFDCRDRRVLEQFGDVRFYSLDHAERSLACHKAEVMQQADSDYVTWVDSDAMFRGNCSDLLPPPDEDHIRVRRRRPFEMTEAFPSPYDLREILPAWRADVASAAGIALETIPEVSGERAREFCSCSSCYLSVARAQDRFLRVWQELSMRLPRGNVGVVDRSLRHYHQLDESCLNAVLEFLPEAPTVTETYGLDLDPQHLFIHFVGQPKPWQGWIPYSLPHFESVVSTVEWALSEGLTMPSAIPASLRRRAWLSSRLFARWNEIWSKLRRRITR